MPPFFLHSLFSLLLLLFYVPFSVISQTDQTTTTLLDLKQKLGNPPALQAWNNSSSSPCSWPGIQCADNVTVTGLDLNSMDITATVPDTICDLKNLTFLNLANNSIPGEFPKVVYNCTGLQHLDISRNYFVGLIPQDIDTLSSLEHFDASGNNFTGDIPVAIGNMSKLNTLYMYSNLFNGSFPKEIGNLSDLENLGLAFNGFAPARIPTEFGKLKKLQYMWMRENNLISSIPDSFGDLVSLRHLDLAANDLEGDIPGGLFLLKNLELLYLFQNQLSGQIPETVESLNLTEIDLSTNNLTGNIPDGFGKLQNLEVLHLFSNHLSGAIPSQLGDLTFSALNLSSNDLSRRIPEELDNLAYDFSFLNNPILCAVSPVIDLPSCHAKVGSSKKMSSKLLAVILALSLIVFLATVIVTLLMVRNYRQKKLQQDLATWKLTSFQRLNFTEEVVLGSLTEGNLIGNGGSGKVYRVPINRAGEYVADDRLAQHIERGNDDGLYISSVASCSNFWALIMDAGTGFTAQVYKLSPVFLHREWIMEQWINNYYISAVAGANNGSSLVVMSKGTKYTQQSYKVHDSFPYKWINKKWCEGFYVTAMATAGSRWAIVMSRGANFSDQVVELFPCDGIHRRWDNGYRITSTAATLDQAAFVLSVPRRNPTDETQETLRTQEE